MSRYAGRDEIQRAVNLQATGMSVMGVARAVGKARGTVDGWLKAGGVAERSGITPKVETVIEEVPPAIIKVRVKAGSLGHPEGPITRILGIGDAHDDPHTRKDRFRWMGKLAADRGVDGIHDIGDFSSLDSLNQHIADDTLAGKTKNPFNDDIQSRIEARGALDEGLGSHKPRKTANEGNHERRVFTYEDMHPAMAGRLVSDLRQADADFGWETAPYGEFIFIAGVGFVHCPVNRLNKAFGGENSPIQVANKAVFDIVYGHEHLYRMHRAAKIGPSKHVTVLNLGCALPHGRVESYMLHGATTGWWFGCHVISIQGGQIIGNEAVSMLDLERMYA